jgi:ABC-type glycerol-3-phosphate transport system substrate-binding protein
MKRTRILALILSLIISVCLCSCEEKATDEALIYKSTAIGVPCEEWNRVVGAVFADDTLTLLTAVPGKTFENGVQTEEYAEITMNTDGEITSRHDLPRSEPNRIIIYYAVNQSDDGVFYAVKTIAELENPNNLENVKSTTEFVQFDENFNETTLFVFDDVLGSSELWITDFTVTDGLLYFTSYSSPYTIDIEMVKAVAPAADEEAEKAADENREIAAKVSSSGIFDIRPEYYFELPNDEYIIIGDITNGIGSKIYKAALVDPADISDRIPVKLAMISPDVRAERLVSDFNAQNAVYRVEIESYRNLNLDVTDINALLQEAESSKQRFNLALVSGNPPDLVWNSGSEDYRSFVEKGIYADLMPYFNSDPELTVSALVPSYAAANMTGERKFSVAQSFTVNALVGKESLLGEKSDWRFSELVALCDEHNIPYLFSPNYLPNREMFINTLVLYSLDSFIDYDTGTCNFDSPDFIEMLEYALKYPEVRSSEAPDVLINRSVTDLREGNALFENSNLSDFRSMVFAEQKFGEPIAFIDYPNGRGVTGLSVNPRNEMSIVSGAENPDGAWEFMKYVLTKGYIENDEYTGSSFPTVQSRLDARAANVTKKSYITDTGERIDNDGFDYTTGGIQYFIKPLTDEQVKKVYAQIDRVTSIERLDINLINILRDDVTAYLNGSKSAAETAAMIQNRASTYMAESR